MACPDRTGEGAVTTEVEMVVKSLENKAASRHQKLETSLGNLSWSLRGPSSSAHPWCVCVCVCVCVCSVIPTLCDPMDCSPPGSSVHGILQVRILEKIAIPFSSGSS